MDYPDVPTGIGVGALIVRIGKVLLGKRGTEPNMGCWDIIAGFVDPGESLEGALKREILEEIGCRLVKCQYFFSSPNIYNNRQVIVIVFICEIEGEPQPSEEISEVQWITKETAFPITLKIPKMAIEKFFASQATD